MPEDHQDGNGEGSLPTEREPVFYLEQIAPEERSPAPAPGAGDDGLDWRRMLESLWRWKWVVVGASLLGIAAGAFLMQRSQPLYETRTTIWLGPSGEETGPIRPTEIFEGQGWADLLSSQAVLEPVVREQRLFVDPVSGVDTTALSSLEITDDLQPGLYRLKRLPDGRFELRRGDDQVVERGRLGEDAVGVPAGFRWSPDPSVVPAGSQVAFRVMRPADAAGRLRSNLMVAFSVDAGNLINSQFTWTSPAGAARLHNQIVDSFMQVAQRLKSQKLKEVVSILEQQTDYAADRLDSAELALKNFRVETITLPGEPRTTNVPEGQGTGGGGATQDPVFGAFFEKKLTRDQLQAQVRDLRNVLERLEQEGELDVLALRMNPAVERSQQLQEALTELTQKQSERRTLLYQYTEEYPPVQEVTQRIEALEQQVIPGLVRNLVGQLEARRQELDTQIDEQAGDLRQIPNRSIREARLRREVEMAEQLHSNLLTRLKEAELAARTNLPDLQVVDRATPPGGPSENPGPRLFLVASMAGIGLGVGGSLLLDRLDRKVRYPDQVASDMGINILGVVPRIPSGGRDLHERRQETVEAFRAIRGQLSRMGSSRQSVSMITSPSPREGKTLVTTNLGISFAASGNRTLVVDCDTRRGNLHRFFGQAPGPGLAEVLRGEARLADVETATEFDGLHLVPRGDIQHFNPELLDGPEMDAFLRDVRGRYDMVLLDAPPLMAGADTLFLGERTDRVVVVLRTGQTDRDEARARLAGIGNFDLPVAGAILNDVPAAARYYQYYYYSYGPEQIEGQVVTG